MERAVDSPRRGWNAPGALELFNNPRATATPHNVAKKFVTTDGNCDCCHRCDDNVGCHPGAECYETGSKGVRPKHAHTPAVATPAKHAHTPAAKKMHEHTPQKKAAATGTGLHEHTPQKKATVTGTGMHAHTPQKKAAASGTGLHEHTPQKKATATGTGLHEHTPEKKAAATGNLQAQSRIS